MRLLGYPFRLVGLDGYYFACFDYAGNEHGATVSEIKKKLGIVDWQAFIERSSFRRFCTCVHCCFPEFDTKEHVLEFISALNKRYYNDPIFVKLQPFI